MGGVGGKVEPGETKKQALIRECQEELAIIPNVGEVFMEVTHEYPDLTVHLTLFRASIQDGIPQKLEHNDIRWITVDEIEQYEFCPADEEILRRLDDTENAGAIETSQPQAKLLAVGYYWGLCVLFLPQALHHGVALGGAAA